MNLRDFEIVSKYNESYDTDSDTIFIEEDGTKREFIKPYRATQRSAGYDIINNTGHDLVINPGFTIKVSTYLKSYMLPDEVLSLVPRSGHGFKYLVRLANTIGIIDSDYYNNSDNEGEIFLKLTNPERSGKTLVIKAGEGMCQGIFSKVLYTDSDINNKRTQRVRDGGIGSTNSTLEPPAILG